MSNLSRYLFNIKGGIYKILPLWEEHEAGVNVYLDVYLPLLADELSGALSTYPELKDEPKYMEAIYLVNNMLQEQMDHDTCKHEVFHMLTNIEKLEAKYHV